MHLWRRLYVYLQPPFLCDQAHNIITISNNKLPTRLQKLHLYLYVYICLQTIILQIDNFMFT